MSSDQLTFSELIDKHKDDDFFKIDETGKLKEAFEFLISNGSLKELYEDMCTQHDLLYSKYEEEVCGYSSFMFSWNNWIYNLLFGGDKPDPVIVIDEKYLPELSRLIHWFAWRVIEDKARAIREAAVEQKIVDDEPRKYQRNYNVTIQDHESKRCKTRHLKTDRLYTLNRVVGGAMGEIWSTSKNSIQITKRLKQGKKVLTKKQRDHAHVMYKISLSLRTKEQSQTDIPQALATINKGGLFIADKRLLPYAGKICKIVVDEYRKWKFSAYPARTISK